MNSSVPPAPQEYAGDEVNALVLDPGSNTIRAGFAGEDTPKSVIPSFYGLNTSGSGSKLLFGENAIHSPVPNMEIRNPFNEDGVVEDWDTASKLFEYSITSRLTGQAPTPASKNGLNDGTANGDEDGDVAMESVEESEKPMAENPLLMSEPAWNPLDARKKAMQVAFEDWGVPAFWLGKTGMLAAFASGKPNALIIDIGANTTSVTPVWDGFVLTKGVQKSNYGSNYISKYIRHEFDTMSPKVPIVPHYMVKSKAPVDAGAPSNATYVQFTTPPTDSFRHLQEERVLTSFKESMVQVWPGPGKLDDKDPATGLVNFDTVKSQPSRPFEMPDGFNQVFGHERFRVVESLFDANYDKNPARPSIESKKTIPAMVSAALNAVDVEIRPVLLSQVILTGGGSLIEKMAERIQSELSAMFPNPRVRVHTTSAATDRKYGAWIGGSVLASLGTFHQMWVSKKEYEEHGAGIVEKRCR